jgi:hypothetical protein
MISDDWNALHMCLLKGWPTKVYWVPGSEVAIGGNERDDQEMIPDAGIYHDPTSASLEDLAAHHREGSVRVGRNGARTTEEARETTPSHRTKRAS